MYLSKEDIRKTDRITRLNLINGVTGVKPANLIGTISGGRIPNLAIFSSVVHLGSDPALLGLFTRPDENIRRHTLENIMETGCYTINHVPEVLAERAHYTSAKFDDSESEFEKCDIEEEYLFGFKAPFVRSAKLKIGMKFLESVPIKANGAKLIIGEIHHLLIPDHAVNESGQIDLEAIATVGISGLDSYYRLERFARFPYARPDEVPEFGADR